MIVQGNFKYMRYYQGENGEQLVDLAQDPGEMRNAVHDAAHQARLRELRAEFSSVFPRAHDPYACTVGEAKTGASICASQASYSIMSESVSDSRKEISCQQKHS